MSWHINEQGKSIISEMIDKFGNNEHAYIHIFTLNDDFYIFKEDKVVVGKDLLYIQNHTEDGTDSIDIVNVNKIESIRVKNTENNDANSE